MGGGIGEVLQSNQLLGLGKGKGYYCVERRKFQSLLAGWPVTRCLLMLVLSLSLCLLPVACAVLCAVLHFAFPPAAEARGSLQGP